MLRNKTIVNTSIYFQTLLKANAFCQLLKFRLSSLVVFSAAMGYMLGSGRSVDWAHFVIFLTGGFLITGAANIINQILEHDSDKLMKRTADRPLPSGRLSIKEALVFMVIIGFTGIFLLLFYINSLCAVLSVLSLILYAFAYTPLKRITSFSVFVGAIPGALPPMIGWAAITGGIGIEAIILFGIQFIWQFPHFWAIAWVLDDDYNRAGFRLLPAGGKRDLNTAFQIMIYTLVLIPLSLVPAALGMTGIKSAIIVVICGVLFLMQAFYLMKTCSEKAARQMMFGSFFYLPIVQIAFVLDKTLLNSY